MSTYDNFKFSFFNAYKVQPKLQICIYKSNNAYRLNVMSSINVK